MGGKSINETSVFFILKVVQHLKKKAYVAYMYKNVTNSKEINKTETKQRLPTWGRDQVL